MLTFLPLFLTVAQALTQTTQTPCDKLAIWGFDNLIVENGLVLDPFDNPNSTIGLFTFQTWLNIFTKYDTTLPFNLTMLQNENVLWWSNTSIGILFPQNDANIFQGRFTCLSETYNNTLTFILQIQGCNDLVWYVTKICLRPDITKLMIGSSANMREPDIYDKGLNLNFVIPDNWSALRVYVWLDPEFDNSTAPIPFIPSFDGPVISLINVDADVAVYPISDWDDCASLTFNCSGVPYSDNILGVLDLGWIDTWVKFTMTKLC